MAKNKSAKKGSFNNRFTYYRAIKVRDDLTQSAKGIYDSLLDCCRNEWACYPSINYLARANALSRKTVIKGIKALAAKGLIAIQRRWNKITGSNLSNLYTILPQPEVDKAKAEGLAKKYPGCQLEETGQAPSSNEEFDESQCPEIDFKEMPKWKDEAKRIPWTKKEWADHVKTLRALYIN